MRRLIGTVALAGAPTAEPKTPQRHKPIACASPAGCSLIPLIWMEQKQGRRAGGDRGLGWTGGGC